MQDFPSPVRALSGWKNMREFSPFIAMAIMDSEEAIEPVWDRHELDPPAFSTFPRRRPSLKPVSHSAHHLLVWDIYSKLITRLNMGGEGVSFSPFSAPLVSCFGRVNAVMDTFFLFSFSQTKCTANALIIIIHVFLTVSSK